MKKPERVGSLPARFRNGGLSDSAGCTSLTNDASLPAAVVQRRPKLALVYFEEEPGRQSAAKLLTKDEARRIATNIAKLPNLYSDDFEERALRRRVLASQAC
jgi:hypothetical protein